MRTITQLAAIAAAIAITTTAVAAAGTTRIETRPFYGAVVTEEEGVRVFRPLPPPDRVIINPHGRTPLSLGFNETYVTERNYNYNYSESRVDGDDGGCVRGIYGGYGPGHFGRRHGGGRAVGHNPFGGHRGHGGGGHRGGH